MESAFNLRVLAIGNSFSQDALAWLYPLAKKAVDFAIKNPYQITSLAI